MRMWGILGVGAIFLFACKDDPANADYETCVAAETKGDYANASAACTKAKLTSPDSKCGKLADEKLTAMKPKLDEIRRKQEDERRAQEAKAQEAAEQAWREKGKTLPKKINDAIYTQAAWDMGHGTATPVLTIISKEAGPALHTYQDAQFGVFITSVWGTKQPATTTMDGLKAMPFAVRSTRGLTCGDYAPSAVEFYSYGERVFP